MFGNGERAGPARRPEVTIFAVPLLVYFFGRIVRSPSPAMSARFRRARRSAPASQPPAAPRAARSGSPLRSRRSRSASCRWTIDLLQHARGRTAWGLCFPLYPRTINANTATPMVNIANSTSATLNSRLLLMSGHTTLARATSTRSLLFLRADWTRSHLLVRADSTKSHLLARADSSRSQFFVRADSTRSRVIVGSTLAIVITHCGSPAPTAPR